MVYVRFEMTPDGVFIWNSLGEMWCGEDEWVHPESSHFQFDPSCEPVMFEALSKAFRFALRCGWIQKDWL